MNKVLIKQSKSPVNVKETIFDINMEYLKERVNDDIKNFKRKVKERIHELSQKEANAGKCLKKDIRAEYTNPFLSEFTNNFNANWKNTYRNPDQMPHKPHSEEKAKLTAWAKFVQKHLTDVTYLGSSEFQWIQKIISKALFFDKYIPITDKQLKKSKTATMMKYLLKVPLFSDHESFIAHFNSHSVPGEVFKTKIAWTASKVDKSHRNGALTPYHKEFESLADATNKDESDILMKRITRYRFYQYMQKSYANKLKSEFDEIDMSVKKLYAEHREEKKKKTWAEEVDKRMKKEIDDTPIFDHMPISQGAISNCLHPYLFLRNNEKTDSEEKIVKVRGQQVECKEESYDNS
jgi:hypothetical protein